MRRAYATVLISSALFSCALPPSFPQLKTVPANPPPLSSPVLPASSLWQESNLAKPSASTKSNSEYNSEYAPHQLLKNPEQHPKKSVIHIDKDIAFTPGQINIDMAPGCDIEEILKDKELKLISPVFKFLPEEIPQYKLLLIPPPDPDISGIEDLERKLGIDGLYKYSSPSNAYLLKKILLLRLNKNVAWASFDLIVEISDG